MSAHGNDWLEQLDRHLASPCLAWLLGAGVSYGAKIPLMYPLTGRVRELAAGTPHEQLLNALFDELPGDTHIEHVLSQLGDYTALATRTAAGSVNIAGHPYEKPQLTSTHEQILEWIANTIRWGFVPAWKETAAEVGDAQNSLIRIDDHSDFIRALFHTSQAGLQDRRKPVRIFTTNYDTLIEDSLALASVPYWDGFTGGAVAFRSYRFGDEEPKSGIRACVIKMHGSIDWHLGDDGKVWRVRSLDTYPNRNGLILIHPQATKYAATQRDPFAAQFDLFRRALSTRDDNVLAVCGYSFGDDHINQEIELCMGRMDNRTTLIAFAQETNGQIPPCLAQWRDGPWGKRVFVVTQNGIYVGKDGPMHPPENNNLHTWWTFAGVTKLLRDGSESFL